MSNIEWVLEGVSWWGVIVFLFVLGWTLRLVKAMLFGSMDPVAFSVSEINGEHGQAKRRYEQAKRGKR